MALNTLKILKDDSQLKLFKDNALKRSRHFDIEKILPMYEAVYNKLVQLN
jgi:glycosyltransferase involved in cell wall biosynthesis